MISRRSNLFEIYRASAVPGIYVMQKIVLRRLINVTEQSKYSVAIFDIGLHVSNSRELDAPEMMNRTTYSTGKQGEARSANKDMSTWIIS
jgi:hypothetical protein